MLPRLAVLEGREIRVVRDFLEWAEWLKTNNNHIGWFNTPQVTVSTIFTGVDYVEDVGQKTSPSPCFFETVIMGGDYDGYLRRYTTYDEAMDGHRKAVALLRLDAIR